MPRHANQTSPLVQPIRVGWRKEANAQVERAKAEKAKREAEAETWIAEVRARKAAR